MHAKPFRSCRYLSRNYPGIKQKEPEKIRFFLRSANHFNVVGEKNMTKPIWDMEC